MPMAIDSKMIYEQINLLTSQEAEASLVTYDD